MILLNSRTAYSVQPVVILIIFISIKLIIGKNGITAHYHIVDVLINIAIGIHLLETVYVCLFSQLEQLFSIHGFRSIRIGLETNPTIVRNFTFAFLSFFGSNYNHTIRTARTIQCGSRSIFQYFDRSNIVYIHYIET